MAYRSHIPWFALVLAAAALTVVACSDSGDETTSGGGATTTANGTDTEYVATLCEAALDFQETANTAFEGGITNPAGLAEKLSEPFDEFVDRVEGANPPPDLREWHEGTVTELDRAAEALGKGTIAAISAMADIQFPELPSGAEERLRLVAADNPDCENSVIGFDFAE